MPGKELETSNNSGIIGYLWDVKTGFGVLKRAIDGVVAVAPSFEEWLITILAEIKNSRILVVGNTGTGKTALIENVIVNKSHAEADFKATKEAVQYLSNRNRVPLLVMDSPGNASFFEALEGELEKIPSGHFMGIVNVVSCGYNDSHAEQIAKDNPSAYLKVNGGDINPAYLEAKRKDDLEFLDKWLIERKGLYGKISSILTVINKYDLWSKDEEEVLAYYSETGEYGKRVCDAVGVGRYSCVVACGEPELDTEFRGRIPEVVAVGGVVKEKNDGVIAKIIAMIKGQT